MLPAAYNVFMQLQAGKQAMSRAVAATKAELGTLRTHRPTPELLHNFTFSAYGAQQLLQHHATVSVEAQSLLIAPFDPTNFKAIERALVGAGYNPQESAGIIRINFPPLNEERRGELIKVAKTYAEAGKVSVRQARQSVIKAHKDDHDFSKDKVQKMTDAAIAEIDALLKSKITQLENI